jgi:hypothetical protein
LPIPVITVNYKFHHALAKCGGGGGDDDDEQEERRRWRRRKRRRLTFKISIMKLCFHW